MLKQKFIKGAVLVAALVLGVQAGNLTFGQNGKKKVTFKVRIENVSDKDGILAQDGSKYPFALSPGLYTVTAEKLPLFKVGKSASKGIEAQAEDGDPMTLSNDVLKMPKAGSYGIFNTPVGGDKPTPILPGGAYEFTFTATKGMRLNLIMMYGQSNDLFYAPDAEIDLFAGGKALDGDITDKFLLWDAGTEVNQAPGLGSDQGPRQKEPNTGADENGVVRLVKDGFIYPDAKTVLRVTITAN
jgi:hypothetical protein